MFSFPADSVWVSVRSWASVVWSWVLANNPAIIIAVLTVGIVLPVIFLAITTTVRAFRHDGDTAVNANNALPVTTSRHRVGAVDTLNGASPLPPPASAVRFELETMEEGLPMPPSPSLLEITFPNVQPAPSPRELMMLRMIKTMYVLLAQTLVGTTTSLSPVERMNAACSLVARTVANLGGWRASAAVTSLVRPAKIVTDLFRRSINNGGSAGMTKGRQIRYVALLNRRARTMEEVIEQALWARTMPTIPANLRDSTAIIALLDKVADAGRNSTSNSTRNSSSAGSAGATINAAAAVSPGVEYIPYSGPILPVHSCCACRVGGDGILQ